MTVSLVTFSDESMSRAAEMCFKSAKLNGVEVGRVFTDDDIRSWFPTRDIVAQNRLLFDSPRGCGYWAWKPLIIDALLRLGTKDSDLLIYSDAGIEFIAPLSHIIERTDQDIFLFGNNWEHAHWCKRDVIDEVWPDPPVDHTPEERRSALLSLQSRAKGGDAGAALVLQTIDTVLSGDSTVARNVPWLKYGKQVQASVIFFRVSDYTRAFVAEWLKWCLFEGGRLIDDSPSRSPNHPEFQEHRHDQAILTTMAYREGIRLHYWPAVYNKGGSPEFVYEKLPEYAGDSYPCLFSHHRKRNHEWETSNVAVAS